MKSLTESLLEDAEVNIEARRHHIKITSATHLDSIKDLLTWLCLAIRDPLPGKISISQGESISNAFFLRRLEPISKEKNSTGCWHHLFESAVVAEPPRITHPSPEYWLDLSFELMIQLAAVEYQLMVDGGIILMGYSTALVPVSMIDDNHMLWHLEVAKHDAQLRVDELGAIKSHWLQVGSIHKLREKTALVGWCPEATVLLGTGKLGPNQV